MSRPIIVHPVEIKEEIKEIVPATICGLPVSGIAGRGSHSVIYIVTHEGQKRVLKVPIVLNNEYKKNGIPSPLEIDILTRIRHPNLMYAEAIYTDIDCDGIHIVLPYAPRSFHDLSGLSIKARCLILYKVICATEFLLHQCN